MKMQITLFTLGALATALSMTPAVEAGAHNRPHHHKSRMIEKRGYSGKATFYNTETGNAGSCGGMLSNSGYTVALNAVQYSSSWCGKTITISANGKSHSATIQDECPGDGETCKYGALDMSPALFNYFADPSVGVIDISWSLGGAVESVVSSLTGGNKNDDDDDDSSSNKKQTTSNQDNNDDEEAKKKAAAASQAAASKAAAQASRSSASAAAYASSTAAAAASASRASVSSAAYASSTHAAAISSSKASVAAEKSESRASVSSASQASVSASKSSVSVAAASASAEAARPKNLENFDALFGGLQQLAMAAQS